jgi:hypothetical protein
MKYKINFSDSKPAFEVEGETLADAVSKAVKQGVSLVGADLRHADLRYADLTRANLRYANLQYAKLTQTRFWRADLSYADLWHADLCRADLCNVDLSHANLQNADLSHADLRLARLKNCNLDFSCLPLWCGGIGAKVDKPLAVQALYHACRWLQNVDDEECRNFLQIPEVKKLANKFHRAKECGKI